MPKRNEELTHRQYEVLRVFDNFHRAPKRFKNVPNKTYDRPHMGDLLKALNIKTRGGLCCGLIYPLIDKGFLNRDKEPYEQRGYYMTKFGAKALREYRKGLKDGRITAPSSRKGRDPKSDPVEQAYSPEEAAEHASQLRYLSAVVLLRATVQGDRRA